MILACPLCGAELEVDPSEGSGGRFSCPRCAGSRFRAEATAKNWRLLVVPTASCEVCTKILELPDNVQPGDTIRHCDHDQKVTLEFGSYALESRT